MATQGIVSVVKDGATVVKAVAGDNGYNADKLAKIIADEGLLTAELVFDAAQRAVFGCPECLVVQENGRAITDVEDDLGPLYQEKFSDPEFNPRWAQGIADHVVVVDLSDLQHPKLRGHESD